MRLSILIPCRNSEIWLRTSIESALAQTMPDKEVLVWDDGSTDATCDVLQSFGERIRWFTGAARGGNHARNRLLDSSRGEWVQFLDADDYLEPAKITRQFAEACDVTEADILYSPVFVETWHGGWAAEREASFIDPAMDLFTQWISWQLPQTGGTLWRAEALRRIGGWNESIPCCQEHELYLRALRAGLRWKFCPSPGAVYRIWSEETVCRKDPVRVIRTRTELIDRMLAWLRETGRLTSAHRTAAGQAFFEMARSWARSNLPAATAYLEERRAGPGVCLRGPAAPARYRLAYRLLGFRGAEVLARRLR
jgi:glycosyltransferase involved in cell wall biosynthesis